MKQGLKPAYAYGHKCLGMSDARLRILRRATAKAIYGRVGKGRSLTLQLAVAGEDYTCDVTAAPVLEWASAVWDCRWLLLMLPTVAKAVWALLTSAPGLVALARCGPSSADRQGGGQSKDRARARRIIQTEKPFLAFGSPPCTDYPPLSKTSTRRLCPKKRCAER